METIGNRLKNTRKRLNKSQEELAASLGITKQAISNMETGKSAPSIALLSKLLVDHNVNINYIIAGMGDTFCRNEDNDKSLRETILQEVNRFLDTKGVN